MATFQVGRRFDGAATNVGFAVTTNDGASWRSGLLPGLTVASRPAGVNARASDPVVAYDAAHSTWLISTLALAGTTTQLAISRSTDGFTWGTALAALEERVEDGIAFDKNWLACDNTTTSALFGRCYLVYTHSADRDMLAVSWSDDGGLRGRSRSTSACAVESVFSGHPRERRSRRVYLLQVGQFSISASRSTDGGATWGAPARIAPIDGGCAIRDFRAFPLPSAEVDPTGRFWAAWHDCASPGASSNAVFVATSADGAEWSAPIAVTRGRDAVLPAIGIDPATGRVAIAYMRSRPAGIDVELTVSPGAPGNWSAPRRLSAQSMPLRWMPNTTSGRMLGDYISVHYARGRPLVVWALATEPVGTSFRQAVYATRG